MSKKKREDTGKAQQAHGHAEDVIAAGCFGQMRLGRMGYDWKERRAGGSRRSMGFICKSLADSE
jgi:hypothetical protein